jgi:acyl carrier protein
MSNIPSIKAFVVEEFLPDVSPDQLEVDQDLLADGIVDSLGLLKRIAWIEHRFDLHVDDSALDPDNFRTIAAIDAFVDRAATRKVG